MTPRRFSESGLDQILSVLADRYAFDTQGRIVGGASEGTPPRFVLGRAAEGCIWRFGAQVDGDVVRAIARLAAREPGFPDAGKCPAQRPERLVMIERVLAEGGDEPTARHEVLRAGGAEVAELWTID
jgi:hypothetical protein